MYKKIKLLFKLIQDLDNRFRKLEEMYNKMWEETHPPTMGGK